MSDQIEDKNVLIDKSLPAFPFQCQGPTTAPEFYYGFTRQEYAAIHLKQPTSGTPWLDEMILAAKRDDLAGKAMMAMLCGASHSERSSRLDGMVGCRLISEAAYLCADDTLAVRER